MRQLWRKQRSSIAIGAGSEVAIETADVVLMKSDLFDVIGTVRVSGATRRKMRGR